MADITDGWYDKSYEDFGGGLQSDYEKEVEAAAEAASELAEQAHRDGIWDSGIWGRHRRERDRRDEEQTRTHQERLNELQERLLAVQRRRINEVEEDDEEDDEIIGHVEAFIEAYDVPIRDIPKLTRILDKPHSERSNTDKKLLKKIIAKSKKKKPKIKITRQHG